MRATITSMRRNIRGIQPVEPASTRSLRIYALDPLEAGSHGNCIVCAVPYEELSPGPVGKRIEVIDWDPARKAFYEPVDLDDPQLLAQQGLTPSESDPRFHQQMVYAVVMSTLHSFESALGRGVRWGNGRRLRVYPHGTSDINAYFSPGEGALVFGYFRASRTRSGRTLPGGYVFTCLSHGIVVHETTHALVHALRDKFMEPSNPDTPAFHEAFADIIALLQHFSLPGVVENAIQLTRAALDDVKPLVSLGRQFSDAIGVRGSLRAGIGEKPDPRALDHVFEPHDRGAVLVAALFSALISVYRRRSGDLLRIATGGTGVLPQGSVAADLVHRLGQEVRKTAKHFLNICVRALDYCPPVDIEFGEYLRAMITADRDLEPEDALGYRSAIIEAFRERGIYPKEAFSLAEDSVVWTPFEGRLDTTGIDFRELAFDGRDIHAAEQQRHRRLFHELASRKRNRRLFRLAPDWKVQVSSVQPLHRIGPNRRIHNEIVVELLQTGPALSRHPGAPPFRCGATLIVAQPGVVRYVIFKKYQKVGRIDRQRGYLERLAASNPAFAYGKDGLGLSFAKLHRGF